MLACLFRVLHGNGVSFVVLTPRKAKQTPHLQPVSALQFRAGILFVALGTKCLFALWPAATLV
jgi:hypothetical protein